NHAKGPATWNSNRAAGRPPVGIRGGGPRGLYGGSLPPPSPRGGGGWRWRVMRRADYVGVMVIVGMLMRTGFERVWATGKFCAAWRTRSWCSGESGAWKRMATWKAVW